MGLIIANTFPKSGTGLIRQILSPLGDNLGHISQYDGQTGEKVSRIRIRNVIYQLAEQCTNKTGYITSHIHWMPDFHTLGNNIKMIFLIRDPRDVIVSHAHYIESDENHHLHEYYKLKYVEDHEENLFRSMYGMEDLDIEFPDIAGRFLPYLGWMYNRGLNKIVRYEHISGEDFVIFIKNLAVCLGFRSRHGDMVDAIDPESSPTYRKGGSGGWQEEFTPSMKRAFEDNYYWLLELMGY